MYVCIHNIYIVIPIPVCFKKQYISFQREKLQFKSVYFYVTYNINRLCIVYIKKSNNMNILNKL